MMVDAEVEVEVNIDTNVEVNSDLVIGGFLGHGSIGCGSEEVQW